MIIECPCKKKKFNIDINLIPAEGRNLQCGSCDRVWFYKKEDPIPETLEINEDIAIKENEIEMRKDIRQQAVEMLESSGFRNVQEFDYGYAMGLAIHEMGTARMGHDPKTSVLNKNNQLHAVPNVYVTDGSAMTSSGSQNPSLTYMALTARAANHAVKELKKMNL